MAQRYFRHAFLKRLSLKNMNNRKFKLSFVIIIAGAILYFVVTFQF